MRGLFACFGVLFCTAATASPVDLIAEVRSKGGGFGSAFVIGWTTDALYLVTANHVVRPAGACSADAAETAPPPTEVSLHYRPGERFDAIVLDEFDCRIDFAVLKVDGVAAPPEAAWQGRMGAPARLEKGAPLTTIGAVDGRVERAAKADGSFARLNDGHLMQYQSNFVEAGHSGGLLLDRDGHVVGMVRGGASEFDNRAVRIDYLRDRLRVAYPWRLTATEVVLDPTAETMRTVGWSFLGGGVALLAVGGLFTGLTIDANDEADGILEAASDPDGNLTLSDYRRAHGRAEDFETAQIVAYGLGGAALITGAILLLTADPPTREVSVVPLPDGFGIVGRW